MKPVFIGGCERSGTTLLGAMLGGHSSCLCVPEMQFKLDILRFSGEEERGLVNKSDIVKRLARLSRFRIWELDLASVPCEEVSCQELIEWIVAAYGQKVGKPAPTVWVDHTPTNIRYAWTLFHRFPKAKMIHIIRDGRAVAASVLPVDWGPNEIDWAARFWAERLAYGFIAESLWPDKVIRIRYEDLVRDPENSLKKLCGTLAIDYEPAMSQAAGFNVPRYTARQHALVGSKPSPARVDAWEKQLTSRQIEIFESITADLLESLGYVPKFGLHARGMTRIERIIATIRELCKNELNRYRRRRRKRKTISS